MKSGSICSYSNNLNSHLEPDQSFFRRRSESSSSMKTEDGDDKNRGGGGGDVLATRISSSIEHEILLSAPFIFNVLLAGKLLTLHRAVALDDLVLRYAAFNNSTLSSKLSFGENSGPRFSFAGSLRLNRTTTDAKIGSSYFSWEMDGQFILPGSVVGGPESLASSACKLSRKSKATQDGIGPRQMVMPLCDVVSCEQSLVACLSPATFASIAPHDPESICSLRRHFITQILSSIKGAVPLLTELSSASMQVLASNIDIIFVPANFEVCRQGEAASALFIVVEGQLEVSEQ